MFKMNFRAILSSMQPKEENRGKKFIDFLEFLLELETFGLWGSLDVKKRELDL
jgi:hypothetical protein